MLYAGKITIFQNAGVAGSATYVQSNSCSQPGVTETCAYDTPVALGHLLIVGCVLGGNSDTLEVSDDNGNIYTPVGTSVNSNAGGMGNLFFSKNSSAGATTVTCTDTSATASWVQVMVHEYAGLDLGIPNGVSSSSAPISITPSTTTIVAGSVTTQSINEMVFAFVFRTNSAPLATNGTLREDFVDNVYMSSQDKIVASPGTVYQSTWTIASGQVSFAAIQATFKLPHGRGGINVQ